MEEQIGHTSKNLSKPPSSDGSGFKPPAKEKRKYSGRKRGGQEGHPGGCRNLLPTEQCEEVIANIPSTCCGCGKALSGEDPEPHRHQVIDIPKIEPFVIEHQPHRLICTHCHTSTRAELPAGVESGGFGPQLSHRKVQSLLDQFLGVELSTGAITAIRCRVSESLATLVEEAAAAIRKVTVAHMEETGGPIGNADGNHPERKRVCLWVLVTPALAVFHLLLSRSGEVAKQVLGEAFSGIVVTGCYGAYNWLPLNRRQICWAHIKRDFTAIEERTGVNKDMGRRLLKLERQMFEQWHCWREGQISRQDLKICMQPIRQAIAKALQEASDLGFGKREKTLWACTVRTSRRILKVEPALWVFLDHPDVEPTNNAAERALRPAVIHRKLSYGVQSQRGALCQSRLLTVTTTLKLQGRDVMTFLVEAWEAHKNGQPAPSLLPQRD